MPLIKKVEGRICSIFVNKKGDLIEGGAFIPLFFFREDIKQFQIIQDSVEKIIINLVLKNKKQSKFAEKEFGEVTKSIKKIMKSDITIKYNLVEVINPTSSGKYGYVFSKVKN